MGHFVAVMPKFPARILAGDGITIVKDGISYTFSSDLTLGAVEALIAAGAVKTVLDKGIITSGSVTFTVSAALIQKVTVGAALAVAFAGWPTTGIRGEVELEVVNGGAFAVTWPTVNWALGDGSYSTTFGDMNVNLEAAGQNLVVVWSSDGGTTLYGRAL